MIDALLLVIKIGIDPTIIDKWGIEITWHGLFTAVGVVFGVGVAAWFARRAEYDEDLIYNMALAMVIGGIIGARAMYVIEEWERFENDLGEIFSINTGGVTIYGALIGGTIGAFLYAVIRRVPDIPKAADIAALGAILGMAIGRIGDIINGEHFATATDLPWGVVYTHHNSPSYIQWGPAAEPQHPAVAYELLGDLAIFAALVFIYTRVNRSGVTFFAWVFLYGFIRFFLSFLRLDDEILLGLRAAQLVALAAVIVAPLAIIYLLKTPPAAERMGRAARRRAMREGSAVEEHPPG